MRAIAILPLSLLLLAGCGPANNDPGPGGVSVSEAEAVDAAAEIIESRRLPGDALPQTGGDNAPLPPERPQNEETSGGEAEE